MKNYLTLLLTIGILFSCQSESSSEDAYTSQEALEYFQNISGQWAMQPNGSAVEVWQKTDDMVMGHGVAISEEGDSSYTEAYFLELINDSLRLEVQPVTSAGISIPIQYYLTESKKDRFVFENPKHTFPKKMTYVFRNNQYQVLLEGDIDGFGMQSDLLFKKK